MEGWGGGVNTCKGVCMMKWLGYHKKWLGYHKNKTGEWNVQRFLVEQSS